MTSTTLARFPEFQSDPTASLVANFNRLAIQEGWGKKSKTYKTERRGFLGEAVSIGFVNHFGGNVSSLQAWQSLCQTIGVPETRDEEEVQLTSIRACQNVSHDFILVAVGNPLKSRLLPCFIGPERRLRQSCRSCRRQKLWSSHSKEIQCAQGPR